MWPRGKEAPPLPQWEILSRDLKDEDTWIDEKRARGMEACHQSCNSGPVSVNSRDLKPSQKNTFMEWTNPSHPHPAPFISWNLSIFKEVAWYKIWSYTDPLWLVSLEEKQTGPRIREKTIYELGREDSEETHSVNTSIPDSRTKRRWMFVLLGSAVFLKLPHVDNIEAEGVA